MIRIRNLILILIFHCCAHALCAQQSKSLVLPGTGWIEQSTNALQLPNGDILISLSNSPSKMAGYVHTNVYRVDPTLSLLYSLTPISNKGNNHKFNKLVELPNYNYAILQSVGFGGIIDHYNLIINNSNYHLDTIYIDQNNDGPITAVYSYKNMCIAVIGSSMPNINTLYDHFRLYDTLGNLVYERNYNFVTGALKMFNKDSGYSILGNQTINNVRFLKYYELDKTGKILVNKMIFPSISIDQVYDIIELPDGHIRFIVAAKPSGTTDPIRRYIATVSSLGDSVDLIDTKFDIRWPLINDSMSLGSRMTKTSDGHYLYTIFSEVLQQFSSYIVKMDTNYNIIWLHKTYAPGGLSHLFPSSDGGYYGIAEIPSTDPEKNREILVFKSDSTGFYNSVRTFSTEVENEIFLSPNPAITQVHITSPVKLETYTISNTSGTQLQSGVLDNDNNIDISQLPQGLYFLQVQLENGQMVTKKLVRSY